MPRGYRFLIVAACGLALFVALGAGAFFGALYAPHYGDQAKESTYHSTKAKEANPGQIDRDRAGLPYLAERIASGPDPKNGDESQKRDLAAQEASALWAFWLLVISLAGTITTIIGTGFLLWQIILTREAVQDTGKATEAMGTQNAIAIAAQRAWMVCEPVITKAEIEESTLILEWEWVFSNIGATVARDVCCGSSCKTTGDNIYQMVPDIYAEIEKKMITQDMNIIPKETVKFGGGSWHSVPHIRWIGDRKRINIILCAVARYKIEGSDDWHKTARSFFIRLKGADLTSKYALYEDGLGDLRTNNVETANFGHSIST